MKSPELNMIALVTLLVSVGLMVFLFAESRNDPSLPASPDLRFGAGHCLCLHLARVDSQRGTGKDLTKCDHADLPPNTTTTDTSTVKVGPVDSTGRHEHGMAGVNAIRSDYYYSKTASTSKVDRKSPRP